MKSVNGITYHLKRLKNILDKGFNFILVFLVYWIGVSISFLLLKASESRKKKVQIKTYWVDYERESSDYRRQY